MAYSQYNPMYSPSYQMAQQRLMQLEQQTQPQMQQTMGNMVNGLICNQVTNIQEAQAYQVPLGAIGVFVDLSTSKIYVKKPIGNDGRPEFNTYVIEQQTKTNDNDIETRLEAIEKRVTILEKYPINKKKVEVKDVE